MINKGDGGFGPAGNFRLGKTTGHPERLATLVVNQALQVRYSVRG